MTKMNSILRISPRWAAVAAAALALGFGTAYAAEEGMGGGWHHGWHGRHHDAGMMLMMELGKLHNELKLTLTPAQEQAWQSALQTMNAARDAARADHEAARKQLDASMRQPVIDLNALHDAHEKLESREHERREQVTAAWLNVYDSLSEQQKKVVSDDIKARFARMADRHPWIKQHGADGADGPAEPAPSQNR